MWMQPIKLDPAWKGGDYYGGPPPRAGLEAALRLMTLHALDSDWAFTALNVLPHGIPYVALVWVRSAQEGGGSGLRRLLVHAGPWAFLALILALGLGEEWLWDLGIWHDHPALFGDGWDLGALTQTLLVPLLALPQAVHYTLDAYIWRRREFI